MIRVVIVRHGMTKPNTRNECLGLRDVELNETGRHEAGLLASRLIRSKTDSFDAIYSSPLCRAIESAMPINRINLRIKKDSTIIREPALTERDWGRWEGMTLSEIDKKYPEEYAAFTADRLNFTVPGGEPSSAVQARVNEFLERILPIYDDTHGICLVTHLGTARHIISHLLGLEPEKSWSFRLENGSAAEILYDPAKKSGILRTLSI